jgi:hypothetical protein
MLVALAAETRRSDQERPDLIEQQTEATMNSFFATNWPTLLWLVGVIGFCIFQVWVIARREHQTVTVWTRDNWTLLVSVVGLAICVLYFVYYLPGQFVRAEAALAGPRTEMTGFKVIDRPATCVYVYADSYGSSLTAVPKTNKGC